MKNPPVQMADLTLPADSRQLILVIADDWNSLQARLSLVEKTESGWQTKRSFAAVCGKNGMAWGIGYAPSQIEKNKQPQKKEGDGKSPAGVFRLGQCWGYAPALEAGSQMDYRQILPTMQGVDDPDSHYYNQIVDTAALPVAAVSGWKSFEVMRRQDDRYKWLLVVEHNPQSIPGYGSLIFLHIWKNATTGTAGCTAVSEPVMLQILSWLRPDAYPVLAQMPRQVYAEIEQKWGIILV